MTPLRNALRRWVIVWLVVQVASLSALVPADCCAAHRSAHESATAERPCHESRAATHCPMPAADGTACPMHQRIANREGRQADSAGCVMRGTCDGPRLFTLLPSPAILPASAEILPPVDVRSALVGLRARVISRFQPPDLPPPRA
jgi:hypothetical protein